MPHRTPLRPVRAAGRPRRGPAARPPGDEEDRPVLGGGEPGISRVGVRDVAGAQEVEQEAGQTVQDGEQAEQAPLEPPPRPQRPEQPGDGEEHEGLVEPQVVPGPPREADGQGKAGEPARVVVHEEAADARDAPAGGNADRERVAVPPERRLPDLEEEERGEDAAEESAERRKAVPEGQDAARVAKLLGVVEPDVHQVADRDPGQHSPEGEVEDGPGVETPPGRGPGRGTDSQRDPQCRE